MNWQELVPGKLYSFEEKVRVELGPQIIELDCTDENLKDKVTSPHYKIGARDAYGRIIRPDEAEGDCDTRMGIVEKGEKMSCVDWRSKHVPHVWKVYVMVETGEKDKKGKPVSRFIKVDEIEDKKDALAHAEIVYGEMQ